MNNFINFDDFDRESVEEAIEIGINEKNKFYSEDFEIKLNKKFGVLLFEKPSLRTKLSFIKALNFNGINDIYFSPEEVGLGKREKVSDIAKVISKMSEVVILRTFKHSTIEEFSRNSSVPVINALSDREHPCQALCDLLTIKEKTENNLNNISITFVGDGNNVATSLAKAILTFGGTFIHSCPEVNPSCSGNAPFVCRTEQDIFHRSSRSFAQHFLIHLELFARSPDSPVLVSSLRSSAPADPAPGSCGILPSFSRPSR